MKDILAVIRKHDLPVQSVVLNISMLDADFDEQIPYLQTYKAGYFHKPMTVDDIPMLFRAQRRVPFKSIIDWLQEQIRPGLEEALSAFEDGYPDYTFTLTDKTHTRSESDEPRQYVLGLKCVLDEESDDPVGYNVLDFSIVVNQMYPTDYPKLGAHIGWLVDREGGDDWGLDIVYRPIPWEQDVADHVLKNLFKSMPASLRHFRSELDNLK